MTTEAWLMGHLPVEDKPGLAEAIEALRAVLEPEEYDLFELKEGILYIGLFGIEVPHSWIGTSDRALIEFATNFGAAGAVFRIDEHGLAVLAVGPTAEERQAAYVDYFQDRLCSAERDLQIARARPVEDFE